MVLTSLHSITEVDVPQREREERNRNGYEHEILHCLSLLESSVAPVTARARPCSEGPARV
jgi:hypothetical protein